jgi:hypothetical protein
LAIAGVSLYFLLAFAILDPTLGVGLAASQSIGPTTETPSL